MNNQPMRNLAAIMTEKFIAASPQAAAQALSVLATHEVLLLVGGLKAQSLVAVLNPMEPPKPRPFYGVCRLNKRAMC